MFQTLANYGYAAVENTKAAATAVWNGTKKVVAPVALGGATLLGSAGEVLAQDPTPTEAAITNAVDQITGDSGLAQIAATNSVNMILAVAGFAIAILLVGGGIRLVWRMFSGARC